MTATGLFFYRGWPILIGDTLESRSATTPCEWPLPLSGFTDESREKPTIQVVGLWQKVVLCTNRIVVAWAGPRHAAAQVITALRAVADPSNETLKACLAQIESCRLIEELRIVGCFIENDLPHAFRIVGKSYHRHYWEEDFFDGSGHELLKDAVERARSQLTAAQEQVHPSAIAKVLGLLTASILMNDEFISAAPLTARFGGAYESAVLQNGAFVKVDDALHAFWHAKRSGAELVATPVKLWRGRYEGEDLFLYTANVVWKPPNLECLKEMVHRIAPPDSRGDIDVSQALLLSEDFLDAECCVTHGFFSHERDSFRISRFETGNEMSVRVLRENGATRIELKPHFVDSIPL